MRRDERNAHPAPRPNHDHHDPAAPPAASTPPSYRRRRHCLAAGWLRDAATGATRAGADRRPGGNRARTAAITGTRSRAAAGRASTATGHTGAAARGSADRTAGLCAARQAATGDGGAPGRAVLAYCRSFELDRDAGAYYNRLQREKRLPREDEIAQRNQQSGQTLTLRQYVERDWALRRDNNRSAPQRCKVLGGSIQANTALVVFEADLNGRRQRGTATVQLTSKAWKVRDHGDWAPVK